MESNNERKKLEGKKWRKKREYIKEEKIMKGVEMKIRNIIERINEIKEKKWRWGIMDLHNFLFFLFYITLDFTVPFLPAIDLLSRLLYVSYCFYYHQCLVGFKFSRLSFHAVEDISAVIFGFQFFYLFLFSLKLPSSSYVMSMVFLGFISRTTSLLLQNFLHLSRNCPAFNDR